MPDLNPVFGQYLQRMRMRRLIEDGDGPRPVTRDELAAELHISVSLLEKWELGKRRPTEDRLGELFAALEVPYYFRRKIRQLLGYPDPPEVPAWPSELSELAQRHLDDFRGPAMIHSTPLHFVYAVNDACREMMPGLEPAPASADRPASLLEWLFFHPGARQAFDVRDRHSVIRALLWQLRFEAPGVVRPEEIEAVLAPLRESPDFDTLWNADSGDLAPYGNQVVRLHDRGGASWRYSIKTSRDEYPPGPYVTYQMTRLDSSPLSVRPQCDAGSSHLRDLSEGTGVGPRVLMSGRSLAHNLSPVTEAGAARR